jgi:hypothetical protein
MLYAAIDIHKRMFQAAVLDVETGETVERRFGATRGELSDWATPLQGTLVAVAIEATNGWWWVWRELSARGFDVRLVDPAQANALRGRVKLSHPGFRGDGAVPRFRWSIGEEQIAALAKTCQVRACAMFRRAPVERNTPLCRSFGMGGTWQCANPTIEAEPLSLS